MPLRPTDTEPTHDPRVGVVFVMLDETGRPVRCAVTRAAIEERAYLDGNPFTDTLTGFIFYRELIERAAGEKYKTLHTRQTDTVFIFAKDLNPGQWAAVPARAS